MGWCDTVRLYLWSILIISFHPWNSQCILATLYKKRCWSHMMVLLNCLLPTFDETKVTGDENRLLLFCDTCLHSAAIFTRESSWWTGDICPDMFYVETMFPVEATRIGTKHRVLQYSTIHTGSLQWVQMGEWCGGGQTQRLVSFILGNPPTIFRWENTWWTQVNDQTHPIIHSRSVVNSSFPTCKFRFRVGGTWVLPGFSASYFPCITKKSLSR